MTSTTRHMYRCGLCERAWWLDSHDPDGFAARIGWDIDRGAGQVVCPACSHHDPGYWQGRPSIGARR